MNNITWFLIGIIIILVILYIINNKKESYGYVRPICNVIPEGKYINTCSDCIVNTKLDVMKCNCKDVSDFDRTSLLYNVSKCNNIENINGKLECVHNVHNNVHNNVHKN